MAKTDLVIFGSTGDLAKKKLFPSLFKLFKEHVLPSEFKIIAVTRTFLEKEALSELILPFCVESQDEKESFKLFLPLITVIPVELLDEHAYLPLMQLLRVEAAAIFYFAISPELYGSVAHHLKTNHCVNEHSRVVVEKPLGSDLISAQAINAQLTECFREPQIFRIDHYLGKETVQNIMALRFGNAIFEPLWNGDRIQYIQITVAE